MEGRVEFLSFFYRHASLHSWEGFGPGGRKNRKEVFSFLLSLGVRAVISSSWASLLGVSLPPPSFLLLQVPPSERDAWTDRKKPFFPFVEPSLEQAGISLRISSAPRGGGGEGEGGREGKRVRRCQQSLSFLSLSLSLAKSQRASVPAKRGFIKQLPHWRKLCATQSRGKSRDGEFNSRCSLPSGRGGAEGEGF